MTNPIAEQGVPDAGNINVVLTFTDPDGRHWLAGALLGPLVPDGHVADPLGVDGMPDVALSLVSFKVVRRD